MILVYHWVLEKFKNYPRFGFLSVGLSLVRFGVVFASKNLKRLDLNSFIESGRVRSSWAFCSKISGKPN
jgi:hypothetical protein